MNWLYQQVDEKQKGEQGPGAHADVGSGGDPDADDCCGDQTGEQLGTGEEAGAEHGSAKLAAELGI